MGRQQSIRMMRYHVDPAERRWMWPADPEPEIELDDDELAANDAAYVDHIMREYDQEDQDGWLFSIEEDDSDLEGDIGIIDATGDIF
eukprot:8853107-Heterocapsa_arctica.AAC.1